VNIFSNTSLKTRTLVTLLSIVLVSTIPLIVYYRTTFDALLSIGVGSDKAIEDAISLAISKSSSDIEKENSLSAYRSYHQTSAIKEAISGEMRTFTLIYFIAVLSVSALAGWILVSRITKPLAALAEKMRNTGRSNSDTQVLELNPRDEIASLTLIFNAMTKRLKEAAQRELLAERRSTWEQVARILAHEIKNPLTPIKLSTERLYDRYINQAADISKVMESTVKTVLAEISNLERLVESFHKYARFPDPVMEIASFTSLVNEVKTLFSSEKNVISVKGTEKEIFARMDSGQIKQVLNNLIKNGIEATELAERDKVLINITISITGSVLVVSITDNGIGIPSDIMPRIFLPAFTTKSKGSGIGLALCERIIAQHDGSITAKNRLEGGAEFIITMPCEKE